MNIKKHTHLGSYAVITQNGKIALIRKARGAYTGMLDLAGGSIEFGESPVEAVEREVLEETGLTVITSKLLRSDSAIYPYQSNGEDYILHHLGFIFECEVDSYDINQAGDDLDSAGAGWYDIASLDHDNITPFVKSSII